MHQNFESSMTLSHTNNLVNTEPSSDTQTALLEQDCQSAVLIMMHQHYKSSTAFWKTQNYVLKHRDCVIRWCSMTCFWHDASHGVKFWLFQIQRSGIHKHNQGFSKNENLKVPYKLLLALLLILSMFIQQLTPFLLCGYETLINAGIMKVWSARLHLSLDCRGRWSTTVWAMQGYKPLIRVRVINLQIYAGVMNLWFMQGLWTPLTYAGVIRTFWSMQELLMFDLCRVINLWSV